MKLYEIIGLTKKTIAGYSYETNSNNYILRDETTDEGISKISAFNDDTIYVVLDNSYYAIRLSNYHCASFSGKLCHIGMMQISPSNYTYIQSAITHVPIQPLFVLADFESKLIDEDNYDDDDDDMHIYLHNEPDTFVFKFSRIGGNEAIPCGYVYVNMELFTELL